jgi:hypothetical protein
LFPKDAAPFVELFEAYDAIYEINTSPATDAVLARANVAVDVGADLIGTGKYALVE